VLLAAPFFAACSFFLDFDRLGARSGEGPDAADGAPADASQDEGPADASGDAFACRDHPDAWICDSFDDPSAGIVGWLQCVGGVGSVLEVSTKEFYSPPSSLHAVISADGGDAGTNPCGQSAFVQRHGEVPAGTPVHVEFEARLVRASKTVDADFSGATLGVDSGIISTPSLVYSAQLSTLALTDMLVPDAGTAILGGPGMDWFHVSLDFAPNGILRAVVQTSHDRLATSLSFIPAPDVSIGFGLRAHDPAAADYEIYIDDVLAE
jgi:hypothetical protein